MEQSIQKQLDQIRTGLQILMNPKKSPANPVEIANPVYYWVNDIYDTFAVVEASGLGKFYKVEYSWDADGNLSFGDPIEVEKDWKPVSTVKCLWTLGDESPLSTLLQKSQGEQEMEDVLIGFGGSVKALPTGEVEGCLVRFSTEKDTDLQGDFFAKDTDFGDHKEIDIMYHHGQDPKLGSRVIGKGILTTDDVGVWIKGQLFLRDKYEKAVLKLAQMGKLGWSAGTAEHLFKSVRVGKANKITCFRLGLDATMATMPIEPRNGVVSIKSFSIPAEELTEAAVSASAKAVPTIPGGSTSSPTGNLNKKEEQEMGPEEIAKMIADGIAANEAANAKKAADQAAIDKLVEEKVAAGIKEKEAEFLKAHNRLPFDGSAPATMHFADTNRFDAYSPADLALTHDILKSAKEPISPALVKSLAIKCVEIKDDVERVYVHGAMKACGLNLDTIKAATDPDYTTGSGVGSDWVGTAYSQQIWEKARALLRIVQKIPTAIIPDGFSSQYFPLEYTDPTWYKVAEATASDATLLVPAATVTNSQLGTANKQITVGKMGARSMYTGEMTEDSLVNYAAELRAQLEKSCAEMMEHICIDGDATTTGSTNINDIGNSSVQTATNLHLITNGFRKLALVTNTANSRSASGGLAITDFIETAKLLGTVGMAMANPGDLSYIVDPNVLYAASVLPEVLTKDIYTNATLENGLLARAFGVEVIPSWFMHYKSATLKANTAGKVDQTTVANNTTGSILAVWWKMWKLAYKRRMTIETNRIANADATEVVALTRWGLGYRDTEASAISYYVGA